MSPSPTHPTTLHEFKQLLANGHCFLWRFHHWTIYFFEGDTCPMFVCNDHRSDPSQPQPAKDSRLRAALSVGNLTEIDRDEMPTIDEHVYPP